MACQDPNCKNCNAPWRQEEVTLTVKAGPIADILGALGGYVTLEQALGGNIDPDRSMEQTAGSIVRQLKEKLPGFVEAYEQAEAQIIDHISKVDQAPLN